MEYKIAFKKSVSRDLKKIDKEQADRILKKIEDELPQKAETLPGLTGKFSGLRKFRVGDFRVIFSIIGDTALILRIWRRKEVYRSNITSH
ncbi:MAG: type II toxin-antitoxin system RelE/ParE family toxin [Deltaproteobacteria bacterium]|nr:type II toxin-antitoxin system RelE/ParE family toxin [Deltaproteobacteria bacterium]MBW2119272.1 type II toxin-antitoxin system RelE/ParE family toxin [Deltaproteobacteria bacterium]MBW2344012.1 type II toxin-antitoxin system RelE/ParE family toxin [Deltaproteobacteria bacterium]